MDSNLKPVEIVTRKNFKFSLNEANAAPYFLSNGFQDMDVAVIVIAGLGRYGKSFIMNFFLRYAKYTYSGDNDPSDWLKDQDQPLIGFPWEGETESSSTCLNMWPEFFVHTQGNGNKICLIFMDTQTGDERDTAAAEYSSIMTICAMVSSVFIVNVGTTIQEATLQHLEVFAEYGRMAMLESGTKPYQRLLFLVRDWRVGFQFEFGFEGGHQYLEQFFDKNKEERASIRAYETPRENLPKAFQEIECFLMPRVGERFMYGYSSEFQGNLKSLDKVFVEQLGILVPEVIGPAKLTTKAINGQQMSVKELFVHLGKWVNIFNGPTMPVPTSMFNSTVEANNEAAKEISLNWFKEEVSKIKGNKFVNEAKLKRNLEEIEGEALKKFDNYHKMGGSLYSSGHREELIKTIIILKENYMEENADLKHPYARMINRVVTKYSAVGQAVLYTMFSFMLNDFIATFDLWDLITINGYRLPIREIGIISSIGAILHTWLIYHRVSNL